MVAGDARNEASRIVLTPSDAPDRVRWGHARLPMTIDAVDAIEVAFTFAVEPAAGGVDFAEGASFWFASGADPLLTPRFEGLGVPSAPSGVALGLDLRSTTFSEPTPFWGLYDSRAGDGFDLSDVVALEATDVFEALGAAPLAGPHVAIVRLTRDTSGSGEDNVAMAAQLGATSDAPRLEANFVDGADETFGPGFLGFGAESRATPGAVHVLLGAEVKVDGVCVAPP